MTLEELADLIRANGANTNGRIDSMRNEVNATLMTVQNDFTDVRRDIKQLKADLAEVRTSLDLTSTIAAMRKELDTLAAEVAEMKRRAS